MDTSLSQLKLDSLLSVDIYRGIKDLQNIKDGRIENNHVAYVNSGMSVVYEILKQHLINSCLVENILCEYSLISSTLDPFNKGKLDCCAMVYGTLEFKDLVKKFYLKGIETIDKEIGISIYQHPNFLYDIDKVGAKSTITYKATIPEKDDELEIFDEQSNDTNYIMVDIDPSSSNSLWIQAFHLSRPYNEMISEAKDFYQRKKNKPDSWLNLEDVQERLHAYCHSNISSKRCKDSYYISFPIYGSIASNQLPAYLVLDPTSSAKNVPLQGIGACFIYLEVNSQIEENQFKTIVNKISYEIGDLIRFISANYLFNVGLNLRETVLKASLKSAKAAIMSRNMSHNLGSHVMFYIKQKLQSVSKIVDNKVLENIIPGSIANIADIEKAIKSNESVELPFLVGLGRFINYLQERQDYIATVATDYIPARSTISFKDFIYDELKPELRYLRHHSDGSSSDAGWQSGNLLLDYIAYSEQYRESSVIEIRFGQFNGTTPTNDDADNDFKALRKFNIAVPGGVIGRQAIFSIFENIIRNAAKHSGRRADGKMVLELSLLKEENEKFKLNIENIRCKRVDNENEEKGQDLLDKYTKYKDTYHVLRIKLDMPNKEEDIDNLVSKLGEKYVDADGSMVETSKGLKEMRISAAWLRGYSIDSEIPDDEPPVLSIYREPYKGSDYTLSYILCIPKPRKVAFVLNNKKFEEWKHLNNVIKTFGCEVFVVEDINEYYEKKYKENDTIKQADIISDFEIVCMPSDYKDTICPSISSRYIADDGKIEEILTALYNDKDDEQKLKETIRDIYRIWFEATYPNSNSQLVIADEKAFKDKEAECKKLNEGKEDNDKVIIKTTLDISQMDCTDNIVYSTHFKGLEFDKTNYGQMMTASTCIEPITGNNSTARLIRQDEWNEEWQYKLLSSGLAKVAIFDERIFSSFISHTSKRGNTLSVGNIKEMKKVGCSMFKQKLKDEYEIPYNVAEDLYFADNDNEIKAIIGKYDNKYGQEVAQRNHERRIYAFDIREADKETINVVGYNVNIEEHVGQYVNHENDAEIEIAHITYEDKNVKVELTDKGQEVFADSKGEKFDYITIHQGVLDKIYTAFGIKNEKNEKYKVTNALHKCFSKQDTPTEVNKFLPNFIIHSGRSKPSKDDMPQEQPFVQFAAVDHAVKDCKYTLVELLATAHYEESNNNN